MNRLRCFLQTVDNAAAAQALKTEITRLSIRNTLT